MQHNCRSLIPRHYPGIALSPSRQHALGETLLDLVITRPTGDSKQLTQHTGRVPLQPLKIHLVLVNRNAVAETYNTQSLYYSAC